MKGEQIKIKGIIQHSAEVIVSKGIRLVRDVIRGPEVFGTHSKTPTSLESLSPYNSFKVYVGTMWTCSSSYSLDVASCEKWRVELCFIGNNRYEFIA